MRWSLIVQEGSVRSRAKSRQQDGVVPGLQGPPAFPVRLPSTISPDRSTFLGLSQAEGQVAGVHAEVAHDAVCAVEFTMRLQLIGFRGRGRWLQEPGIGLEICPEPAASSMAKSSAWLGKRRISDEQRTNSSGCFLAAPFFAGPLSIPNGFSPMRCLLASRIAQ